MVGGCVCDLVQLSRRAAGVSVSSGSRTEYHRREGGACTTHVSLSQSWGLEVQGQGASRQLLVKALFLAC